MRIFFSWCCCSLGSNFFADRVEPTKYDVYDLQGLQNSILSSVKKAKKVEGLPSFHWILDRRSIGFLTVMNPNKSKTSTRSTLQMWQVDLEALEFQEILGGIPFLNHHLR